MQKAKPSGIPHPGGRFFITPDLLGFYSGPPAILPFPVEYLPIYGAKKLLIRKKIIIFLLIL